MESLRTRGRFFDEKGNYAYIPIGQPIMPITFARGGATSELGPDTWGFAKVSSYLNAPRDSPQTAWKQLFVSVRVATGSKEAIEILLGDPLQVTQRKGQ